MIEVYHDKINDQTNKIIHNNVDNVRVKTITNMQGFNYNDNRTRHSDIKVMFVVNDDEEKDSDYSKEGGQKKSDDEVNGNNDTSDNESNNINDEKTSKPVMKKSAMQHRVA